MSAMLQVRCAAVFALGTFVGNSAERTDHSTTIDHNVAMMLAQLINDGSPVVRKVTATHKNSCLYVCICYTSDSNVRLYNLRRHGLKIWKEMPTTTYVYGPIGPLS